MVFWSPAQVRLYGASCFDSPILLHGWGRDKVWDLDVGTEWGKFGSLLPTSGERFFLWCVNTRHPMNLFLTTTISINENFPVVFKNQILSTSLEGKAQCWHSNMQDRLNQFGAAELVNWSWISSHHFIT